MTPTPTDATDPDPVSLDLSHNNPLPILGVGIRRVGGDDRCSCRVVCTIQLEDRRYVDVIRESGNFDHFCTSGGIRKVADHLLKLEVQEFREHLPPEVLKNLTEENTASLLQAVNGLVAQKDQERQEAERAAFLSQRLAEDVRGRRNPPTMNPKTL